MSYNVQEYFNLEGYFSVHVTPLGANMCLLEDCVESELKSILENGGKCLSKWFKEVGPWRESNVDDERVTWLCYYDMSCQAWRLEFFEALMEPIRTYICAGDNTILQLNMDVPTYWSNINHLRFLMTFYRF